MVQICIQKIIAVSQLQFILDDRYWFSNWAVQKTSILAATDCEFFKSDVIIGNRFSTFLLRMFLTKNVQKFSFEKDIQYSI